MDVPDLHTETLQGPDNAETILQGMPERPGPASSSWWDSPIVMRQLEKLITGDSGISFYEYLKKEHSVADLRKGLSICRKLKGLEQSFIKYHTCAEFDVLNDLDVLDYPERKIGDMKPNRYDFLLSVDALSHIGNLEAVLENVRDVLNNGGYIIALEYIGPKQLQWTEREVAIADRFSLALNSRSELMLNSDTPAGEEATPDRDAKNEEAAVSSDRVIPALKELFDIVGIRYFGGALHELVLNKILCALDQTNKTDVKLIQAIMQCEQILIENEVLNNHYAMIIGRKRISHGG